MESLISDLMIIGLVAATTLITMFFAYRALLFSTFDNEAARIFGIKTESIQLLFSLLLTLSVIASLNVIGVTMGAATLIAPVMTARILTDSFSKMIIYSTLIGSFTGVIGMYLSCIFNVARIVQRIVIKLVIVGKTTPQSLRNCRIN